MLDKQPEIWDDLTSKLTSMLLKEGFRIGASVAW